MVTSIKITSIFYAISFAMITSLSRSFGRDDFDFLGSLIESFIVSLRLQKVDLFYVACSLIYISVFLYLYT